MSSKTAGDSNKISGSLLERILAVMVKDFGSFSEEAREALVTQYQLLIRKTAHFMVYAALGFFASGFWATFSKIKKLLIPIFAVGYVFLYAVSDELHQLFVAGRSGQVTDVLLDTAGGFFGALIFITIIKFYYWRLKGYEAKQK